MRLADKKPYSVFDQWRCPDGGIDTYGYYGHLHPGWDMCLCADNLIRCQAHAQEFNRKGQVEQYISRIRNKGKRDYAKAYLAWYRNDGVTIESEPSPKGFGINFMTGQAVRQHIWNLCSQGR